jgi:hypothetical protein
VSQSGLTREAIALLNAADAGGVPVFASQNLRRIASENGVEVSAEMTPNEILDQLRRLAESPAPPEDESTLPGEGPAPRDAQA